MTELRIRRLPFRFDESVPFRWHRANPEFGAMANGISVFAIALERWLVAAVKQAKQLIDDSEVAAEADAFMQQDTPEPTACTSMHLAGVTRACARRSTGESVGSTSWSRRNR
jgi:predicted metal-dependent hydrolase